VHEQVGTADELAIHDLQLERPAAAGALGLYRAVDVERRRDPERVPRTRPRPRTARRRDAMRRLIEAKRVREPDLERVREEDERVRVVEPAIRVGNLALATPEVGGDLRYRRRATICGDARLHDPPTGEVERVHQ
jgi:hypothetical protein